MLRLWVPLTHRLLARNWNLASSGCAFDRVDRGEESLGVDTVDGHGVLLLEMAASGGHGQVQQGEEVRLRSRARLSRFCSSMNSSTPG